MKRLHKWFYSKEVYFFDLDGTLYLGSRVLPGAKDLLSKLRRENKKLFFFTNNSSRSHREYVRKLGQMGFQVKTQEIIMSTHSLIHYLQERSIREVFLLGTPAMRRMLQSAQIHHRARRAKAVVVGFDKTLDYRKLDQATKLLSQGLPMIVTHPDLFCPTEKGPEPDCGSIAKLLEAASGVKPSVVLGKPHPSMLSWVKKRLKLSSSKMLVVGDRIHTDIAMAEKMGMDSLLVLSGDSDRSDLKASEHSPTFVAESVQDLL